MTQSDFRGQNTAPYPASLTVRQLAQKLFCKEITAESCLEQSFQRAQRCEGVFVSIDADAESESRRWAWQIDKARQQNKAIAPLSGVPISLKDLFDVRGQTTTAGSVVLGKVSKPAEADCDVVARLREAGLLFVGRTNMSEFAFSGMGLNPHYGNAQSVWDRATGRLPGGSSSGSAVSVAEGVVAATMGSDTAGSCRIPAAFNGIVGVKPSYGRLSLKGVFPLSPTSDAPGPLGVDVDSCFLLDQAITAGTGMQTSLPELSRKSPEDIRLLVPDAVVREGLDEAVEKAFEQSLQWLREAGFTLIERPITALDQSVDMFSKRAIVLYEAWQMHQQWLAEYGSDYDPFVRMRLSNGKNITVQEQQIRYREKRQIIADFRDQFIDAEADAIIYPTVACVPPPIAATLDTDEIAKINLRCLKNTASVNYFDGCSISLPCHEENEAPVGLMVSGLHGADMKIYETSLAMESVLDVARNRAKHDAGE